MNKQHVYTLLLVVCSAALAEAATIDVFRRDVNNNKIRFFPSMAFMDKIRPLEEPSLVVSSSYAPPLKQHFNRLPESLQRDGLALADNTVIFTKRSYESINWPGNAPYQLSAVFCTCKRYHFSPDEQQRRENDRRQREEEERQRREEEERRRRTTTTTTQPTTTTTTTTTRSSRGRVPAASPIPPRYPPHDGGHSLKRPKGGTNHFISTKYTEPKDAFWEGSENIATFKVFGAKKGDFVVKWFRMDHEDVYFDKTVYKECGCVEARIHDVAINSDHRIIRMYLNKVNNTSFKMAKGTFTEENWNQHNNNDAVDMSVMGSSLEDLDMVTRVVVNKANGREQGVGAYDCRKHDESEWMVVWGVTNNALENNTPQRCPGRLGGDSLATQEIRRFRAVGGTAV